MPSQPGPVRDLGLASPSLFPKQLHGPDAITWRAAFGPQALCFTCLLYRKVAKSSKECFASVKLWAMHSSQKMTSKGRHTFISNTKVQKLRLFWALLTTFFLKVYRGLKKKKGWKEYSLWHWGVSEAVEENPATSVKSPTQLIRGATMPAANHLLVVSLLQSMQASGVMTCLLPALTGHVSGHHVFLSAQARRFAHQFWQLTSSRIQWPSVLAGTWVTLLAHL